MPPISAIDASGPAVRRTKAFLFQPFRFTTYLKLCLVAVITEGFGANANFNAPGPFGSRPGHSHFADAPSSFTPRAFLTPAHIAVIVVAALLIIAIGLLILYLVTRLRFAYFHCLVHNTRQIRPGWHLYRAQATRFFWLNVVVGLCFLLLAAIISAPLLVAFWPLFHPSPAGSQPNIALFVSLFLPLFLSVFLLVLVFFAADLVLRDFILPHFALENATSGQAWRAVWARIKAEKAPFFVYALLRLILPIAAVIALFIALIIPVLIIAGIFLLIGFGIHLAFGAATGGSFALEILFEVLLGLIALAVALTIAIGAGGPLSTAIREYALLFYGSRYPQLGAVLFPPPPLPPLPTSPAATP